MKRWRNWSGSVDCRPRHYAEPASTDELVEADRDGRGSGASDSPGLATAAMQVSGTWWLVVGGVDSRGAEEAVARRRPSRSNQAALSAGWPCHVAHDVLSPRPWWRRSWL